MKALIFSLGLCLVSSVAFSSGRPHNVFATHRALAERVEGKQSTKLTLPQPSNLSQKAQAGVENAQRAVSMVGGLVNIFTKFLK